MSFLTYLALIDYFLIFFVFFTYFLSISPRDMITDPQVAIRVVPDIALNVCSQRLN